MLDRTAPLDSFSAAGAQALAWRIEDYWRGRGNFAIHAWAERQSFRCNDGRSVPFYAVKSNLGPDGYPPSNLQ